MSDRFRSLPSVLSWAFLAASAAWLIYRLSYGLSFGAYGDESEKIVAMGLVAEGGRLYESVFAHHGPVNYILAHLVGSAVSTDALAPYRAMQIVVMLAGFLLLLLSSVPRSAIERRFFVGVAMLLYGAYFYSLRGHMLLYHTICGLAFANIVFLYLLPSALGTAQQHRLFFLSGIWAAIALFSAYSLLLPLGLLFLSAVSFNAGWRFDRRQHLQFVRTTFLGLLAGAVPIVLWMAVFADLRGYLVYHFYFNQVIYSSFLDFSFLTAWGQFLNIFFPDPRKVWPVLVMIATPIVVGIAIRHRRRVGLYDVIGGLLFFLALVYLNARDAGEIWKSAPLQLTCLVLLAYAVTRLFVHHSRSDRMVALGAGGLTIVSILVAGIMWIGTFTQYSLSQAALTRLASVGERQRLDYAEQRAWLDDRFAPDVPMLAFPFVPAAYHLLGRRPAIDTFYYLPWQAAYEQSPIAGYESDFCDELRAAEPRIVLLAPTDLIWGISMNEVAPCVPEYLAEDFIDTPFERLFIKAEDR